MAIIPGRAFLKVLFSELKSHYNDFYAGRLKRLCDDDCLDGCDGDHFYELPDEYPALFIPQSNTKVQKG